MPQNGMPIPPPGMLPPHLLGQMQQGMGMPPNPLGGGAPPPPANLPPLPSGVDLPAGMTAPDAISRTLSTLPPSQLLDVISQMKQLVTTDPATATALLRHAPQLSYAIFQALLLMGLVKAETLATVVSNASAPPPAAAAPPVALPMHAPPPAYPPQQGYNPTPPVPASPYPPPVAQVPTPVQAPPAQAPQLPADADANALIQQVLAMPQEVIDALAPAERAQLLALRAQFAGMR